MPNQVSIDLLTSIVGTQKSAAAPAAQDPGLSIVQLHDIMCKLAAYEKQAWNPFAAMGRLASRWLGRGGAAKAAPKAMPSMGNVPVRPPAMPSMGNVPVAKPVFRPQPGAATSAAAAGAAPAAGAAGAAGAAPAGAAAARQGMSLKSKLGIGAGLGLGGVVTGGHLYEQHKYDPEEHIYNPFDQINGKADKYDIFALNRDKYNQMAAPLIQQQTEALAAGDTAKAHEIQMKLDKGDFGRGYRAMGLNPFFGGPTGQTVLGNMQKAKGMAQGDYEGAVGRYSAQPGDPASVKMIEDRLARGDLLPQQAEGLRRQLAVLRQRMSRPAGSEDDAARAIKARMRQYQMIEEAQQAPQPHQGPPRGVGYPAGLAPPGWGIGQGYNVGINDYRAAQDDAIEPPVRGRNFR